MLWDLAEQAGVTCFGVGAAYLSGCMKAGVQPSEGRDLSRIVSVGSTGSPLAPEGFDWVYEQLGADTWLFSTSGGTDICTAFVGGVPVLPVYRGELQAPSLGVKLEAWDEDGRPVVGQVGELVITEPMPSMPLFLWNDPDGRRYRESYFERWPGIWRHGDWIEITERGSAIITGRSDSTINRGGIRMGTSEIYRAVLAVDEVVDALVVDIPRPGTEGFMPLFVVLREGAELTDDLVARIRSRIREDCSPRHVPDEIHAVAEVPRTLSGKVLEVPVKRILSGESPRRRRARTRSRTRRHWSSSCGSRRRCARTELRRRPAADAEDVPAARSRAIRTGRARGSRGRRRSRTAPPRARRSRARGGDDEPGADPPPPVGERGVDDLEAPSPSRHDDAEASRHVAALRVDGHVPGAVPGTEERAQARLAGARERSVAVLLVHLVAARDLQLDDRGPELLVGAGSRVEHADGTSRFSRGCGARPASATRPMLSSSA